MTFLIVSIRTIKGIKIAGVKERFDGEKLITKIIACV